MLVDENDHVELLLVDGKHLLWRAASVFYDLTVEDVKTGKTQLTGGIYGFLRTLLSTWHRFRGIVIVAWDRPEGPVARRKMYADYKRRPMPEPGTKTYDRVAAERAERELMLEQMIGQEATLKRLLSLLGVRQASAPNWEADDVIATMCERYASNRIGILSGDRDLLQLVSDNVTQIRPQPKGEFKISTPTAVMEEFGVSPVQILDLKALAGDDGDNVPGARGIGPKTAAKLLKEHKTWQQCLTWATTSTQALKVRQTLVEYRPQIQLSARLVALNRRAKLEHIAPARNGRQAFIELAALKFNTLMADGRRELLMEMGG